MGLPFCKMKLWKSLSTFDQDFSSICSKNLETVINLQSLIEDRGENVPSTSTPGNSSCAWRFSLFDCTNFFLLFKIPEIHFSFCDVSKTTDDQRMSEWANSDRVSESFTKLKSRLTIHVVHSSCGWLLSRNNDEFLTWRCPYNILNLVVKDWDEMSIFSLVDSHILKRVFSIVTLARRIVQILGPNENSMSWWCGKHLDILSLWTSNVKLGSLQCTV